MEETKPHETGADNPSEESKALVPVGTDSEQHLFTPGAEHLSRKHKFWESQPMLQMQELITKQESTSGPVDPTQSVESIRQAPLKLVKGFEWKDVDVMDPEQIQELYAFLTNNYVEDDDNMFRFDYSIPFLQWALTPPGYRLDWHVGVVRSDDHSLVGFISGIPAQVRVHGQRIPMAEINFLCVNKALRTKRLAPVLIKEVTRRVNLQNIWQAVYTAGVVIPTPVAQTRYFHRSLNPVKLVDIGFSRFTKRLNKARSVRLYKLPERPQIPGIRPMNRGDVVQVQQLLVDYLEHFSLYVHFTLEEVEHFLLPRDNVIYSYVITAPDGITITDFCSFYSLPSSVLNNPKHTKLNAAYAYYVVPGVHTITELFRELLIQANGAGFDVFNCLNVMEYSSAFKDLNFGIGDGSLQYYLYNWRCDSMLPAQVGIILV
jgi:glycylpeptide N-tetradecanoyltransferase